MIPAIKTYMPEKAPDMFRRQRQRPFRVLCFDGRHHVDHFLVQSRFSMEMPIEVLVEIAFDIVMYDLDDGMIHPFLAARARDR